MPPPIAWSPTHDATIRRMRASGASWDAIAATVGLGRYATSERGRAIGARSPARERPPSLVRSNRDPLPPGHFESWGAITAGTLLAGHPYPWPPLPVERE